MKIDIIPDCKQTEDGVEFRGTISTTMSRKQCQNWFMQTPHAHNYSNVNLFPDESQEEVRTNCWLDLLSQL